MQPLIGPLSLDRKLDIAGVVMMLFGALLLFGLFSGEGASILQTISSGLVFLLGWGFYVFPLALLGVGGWLVLRNFERVPEISVERGVGIMLLFLNGLAVLHFLRTLTTTEGSFALVESGMGGGALGHVAASMLIRFLGAWGAAISLMAWTLIAVMLTLDVTALDLFQWLTPITNRMRLAFRQGIARIRAWFSRQFPAFKPRTPVLQVDPVLMSELGESPSSPTITLGQPGQQVTWMLPQIAEMLEESGETQHDDEVDRERARVIEETLASFNAPAHVVEINRGPTITQFGVEPDYIVTRNNRIRVRVNKISALADDLALALAAPRIRIQAPVPGKGFVGIEVPNEALSLVSLRDIMESTAFKRLRSPLRFALGQDVGGNAIAATLGLMPHLLIAGATGSGKSVCVNAIIVCLLMTYTPEDLRLIMIDPKRVELTGYNGIPHLLSPVVVEMERVVGALQWVTREMDSRYQKFHDIGTRNIASYNKLMVEQNRPKLPYLVVIIDELADLMMLAPDQTEKTVTRLAQLARATGIHLIIATQRPSVDVVTGLIKANFPARVAFAVASGVDSRVILDQPGAERLLGRGDMLFQAPDAPAPVRLQGVFVSDDEINRLVNFWRAQYAQSQSTTSPASGPIDAPPSGIPLRQTKIWEDMEQEENLDPLYHEAVDLVRRQGRASISMLQRRLRVGYTRSARLIEKMEEKGVISAPEEGTHNREVLDYGDAAPPAGG